MESGTFSFISQLSSVSNKLKFCAAELMFGLVELDLELHHELQGVS
jgi:hypothetical protein